MSEPFHVGDRVRLGPDQYHPGYHRGDTGTIVAVMPATACGAPPLYQVRIDGDKSTLPPAFYADELELTK
jgi:hypothetical protein